jgi:hypothetical protein
LGDFFNQRENNQREKLEYCPPNPLISLKPQLSEQYPQDLRSLMIFGALCAPKIIKLRRVFVPNA